MSQDKNVKVLYEATDYPIFQNRVYSTYQEAVNCPKDNIRLVENLETGLVYNENFKPEMMAYDTSYQNEQGVSAYFQQHLNFVSNLIEQSMGKSELVEIGCGKGFFLEMLLEKGFKVTGFDPAYEGNNRNIINQYFERGSKVSAKGIILRHVLEHIQNPLDFLISIKNANNEKGLIYIEVPCFEWICEHNAWFDVFYEHVNYFRLADFYRMFDNIIESGNIFGGQYIYVIADISTLKRPVIDQNNRVKFPQEFLNSLLSKPLQKHGKSAVWGGSSKGVIFALLCNRMGMKIDIVIDINPQKQGMFIPATGLLISKPEEAMLEMDDKYTIYVMNSNYLNEIKAITKNAYKLVSIDNG